MKNPLLTPEIETYIKNRDEDALREVCSMGHPALVAEIIGSLSPEATAEVLRHAEAPLRAEIFAHLDEDVQAALLDTLTRDELGEIVTAMPHDDRANLFNRMPDETREAVLPVLAHAEREDIRRLSAHERGTAGSVMTSDYATLPHDCTVSEAIERLRREAPDKETIYHAYVLDDRRRLMGFVSLKALILARPTARVGDIMHREVISARVDEDQEEAARHIQKYDLLALPVVDSTGALVGIITHDDAIDIITQEQQEDLERLMAIGGSHEASVYLKTSTMTHFKNRAGWLVILAMLGLLSGYIVQSFEGLLLQFAILAAFMPMLADTGGNTGSQSATLVIRALALKEITYGDVFRVLYREFRVSILLGLLLAMVAFGRVVLLGGGSTMPEGYSLTIVGFAIALALGLQVVTATLMGVLLPLGAARMKWDPAVVASPALTTVVDITGLMIYFSTVKVFLDV